MTIIQAIILGIVQGLTEFIPVSSSGHLVLLHEAFGITENALAFDVALHFGTLLALLVYFHKDIILLINGLLGRNGYKRLAWLLAAATIPAVIVGLLLESAAESALRSVKLVAVSLIVVAVFMLLSEHVAKRYERKTRLQKTSAGQAMAIGVAQAVALIPGVSRSAATITAGLFAGLDRRSATRFSFLLGIPILTGAVAKVLTGEAALEQINAETGLFAVGITSAFVSGFFAIGFLLKYLAHHTLAVFAYYRIALGLLVLVLSL